MKERERLKEIHQKERDREIKVKRNGIVPTYLPTYLGYGG